MWRFLPTLTLVLACSSAAAQDSYAPTPDFGPEQSIAVSDLVVLGGGLVRYKDGGGLVHYKDETWRLWGVVAPSRDGRCSGERDAAGELDRVLWDFLLQHRGDTAYVRTSVGADRGGVWDAVIRIGDQDIARHLVREGVARVWFLGPRPDWCSAG